MKGTRYNFIQRIRGFLYNVYMKSFILKFSQIFSSLFLVISTSSFAEEGSVALSKNLEPSSHLWQIIMSLIFILLLIFVSAWLLKRFGKINGLASDNMQVLANMAIGQRERILLLQVGEEQLLIGVTASRINLLHELKIPIDIEQSAGNSLNQSLTEGLTESFAGKLQAAMDSRRTKHDNKKEG